MQHLSESDKPDWFSYPPSFLRIVEKQQLIYFDPWRILEGEELRKRYHGLKERYSERNLVPFAKRDDSDDIACWEKDKGDKVFIIHDYAESGWEQGEVLESFWAWLRKAIEDTSEYEE
jgi:hypothetical protein